MDFNIQNYLMGLAQMIPYGLIAILAFMAALVPMRWSEGYSTSSEIKGGNTALGLRRFGLFLAIGIGMSGVYMSGTPNFWADVQSSVLYAFLLVVMVHVALWLNDIVALPGVNNSVAIGNRNTAVASAEIGSMVATGFIAQASIAGEGGGVPATLFFFALGQIALALSVRCYAVFRKRCDIVRQVESGNLAAGIVLGAKFAAYGLVLAAAVSGPATGYLEGAFSFATTAVLGFAFLFVVDLVVDWVLIRWHTLQEIIDEKNAASALVFAGAKVGLAWVISTLVL